MTGKMDKGASRLEPQVIRDAAPRTEIERSLETERRRLAKAEEFALIGLWVWNSRTKEIELSPETYDLFRLPRGTPIAMEQLIAAIAPGDRPRLLATIASSIETHIPGPVELTLNLRDGSTRAYKAVGEFRTAPGETHIMDGMIQDVTEFREIERQLQHAADRLNQAQRIAKIGSWTLHPATGAVAVSDQIYALFELDPASLNLSYETIFSVIHPDDRDKVSRAYAASLETQTDYDISYRLRMADGRVKWVHVNCTTEFGPDGAPQRSLGTVQDVTEQHDYENRLRLTADRLNEAQSVAKIGSWARDLVTGVLEWSDAIYELFELDSNTQGPDADSVFALVHPEDREAVTAFNRSYANETSHELTHRLLMPDGRIKWLHVRVRTEFDADGAPQRAIGTVQDVTERHDYEASLRRVADQLNEAQRIAKIGSWTRDLATDERQWSDTIYELYEIDPKAHGPDIEVAYTRVHPDDREAVRAFNQTSIGRTPRSITHRLLLANGRVKWVHVRAKTEFGPDGRPLRLNGTVQDETDRVLAEQTLREREGILSGLFENSPFGMARNAMDGSFLEVNDALLGILGYTREELLARSYWDITPPAFEADEQRQLRSLNELGHYGPYEKNYVHKSGAQVPVRLNGFLLTDASGTPYIWSIIRDLREERATQHKIRFITEALNEAQKLAKIGSWAVDYETDRFEWSDGLFRLLEIAPDEQNGPVPDWLSAISREQRDAFARYFERVHPEDRATVERNYTAAYPKRPEFEYEHRLLMPDGRIKWIQARGATEFKGDAVVRSYGTLQDVSERHHYEERLLHQATIDPVTSLPNRRVFLDRLDRALKAIARSNRNCGILILDLDQFKRINDSRGHSIGDEILHEIGRRLAFINRESDTAARLGGDEFAVLLPDLAPEEARSACEKVAARILMALRQPINIDNASFILSASIGIGLAMPEQETRESIVRKADTALYAAKDAGRNAVRLFDETMDIKVNRVVAVESNLHRAIEAGEFRIAYHPIVETVSKRVVKAEALLRWDNRQLGLVPPDQFIPIAEENGLIIPIGKWVLTEAARQIAAWSGRPGMPSIVTVNISARQISDPGFLETVRSVIAEFGIRPEMLEFELTERVLIDYDGPTRDTVLALGAMGISLSMDDFGTGYSSLSYLTRFPLRTVKIDKSFVQTLGRSHADTSLTRGIIALGRALDMEIVAEGVETRAQLAILEESNCSAIQGYLFTPPIGPDELVAWIEDRERCKGR